MKASKFLIAETMKTLIVITLLALTSCISSTALYHTETHAVDVRKMPLRHGDVECYSDHVDVRIQGPTFSLKSSKLNLELHALTLTLQDPNLYTALDKEGSGYTIYYYSYRGRIYLQITMVPKGFTDEPDAVEYVWTLTSDKICAN